MFCFIADWHSLTTVAENRSDLREASRQVAINYLSAGLDPNKCAIFRQSDVKEHAELHLLLSMITPVGWLERVPTYKEKRDLVKENDLQVSYGLLGYPLLQTADILVYRAHAVPVAGGIRRPTSRTARGKSRGDSTMLSDRTSFRSLRP